MKTLRIATWNIAGARRILSNDSFDYSEEDVEYFAEQLKPLNLDVVCLQESHTSQQDSLSKRLAESLGFEFVYETPGCPSHIDPKYRLTCAILSKTELNAGNFLLPKPSFELRFHGDGNVGAAYDRYVLTAKFGDITIANTHPEPMRFFGRNYEEGEANTFASQIEQCLTSNLKSPLIFAADFNMVASTTLPGLMKDLHLKGAFEAETATRPDGYHTDQILYSPEFSLNNQMIIKTQTDHFLCWAELQYNDN